MNIKPDEIVMAAGALGVLFLDPPQAGFYAGLVIFLVAGGFMLKRYLKGKPR